MKTPLTPSPSSHRTNLNYVIRAGMLVALIALIVVPLFSSSSASSFISKIKIKSSSKNAAQLSSSSPLSREQGIVRQAEEQIFNHLAAPLSLFPVLMPQAQPSESIATYTSPGCNVPSSSFLTGQTVCVKADSSFVEPLSIYWVSPDGAVVQIDPISSTNPEGSRMVNAKGNWRAYLVSRADGSARYVVPFAVSDPQAPAVDLAVVKGGTTGTATAGGVISYHITVKNYGPDTAATVVLTDPVPANLAYSNSSQDSGPLFTRTAETPTTTWEIASLPAGASADFTFIYTVTGVAGETINNTVSGRSATDEQFPNDNDWTATDSISGSGGGATCTLDCPNNIVTTATTHGSGGGANVTYTAPEAFGTCGTVTSTPASGSFFPIGTTTVTSSSSTGGGFCSFTVTVIDSAAPTISCPGNITVTANAGESQAYVPDPNQNASNVGTPTTTGDNLVVTGSRDDGEALTGSYPIGITVITWTATEYDRDPQDVDAQPTGRSASCQQRITVNGSSTLSISCPPNQTVNSPNGCDPAPVDTGTATSNSGSATILGRRSDNLAYSNQAGFNNPYPVGVTTIEWTATGSDGQSASCTQTITVTGTDTTPPTLTVPPDVSATTSSCTATLDDELGVATATDDCGTVSITRSGVPTFACPTPSDPNRRCESFVFPTGTTIITYTATNSSGLTTMGTQRVVVTEDPAIPPTITAPADSSANAGASCQAAVPNYVAGSTASDNCGNVTLSQSPAAGTLVGYGPHTVTVTATDPSGNTASDNVVFTVNDATPPSITAPADSSANADASCQAAVPDYTVGTTAADNCGTVTLSQSPAAGTLVGYGPHTVTVTANDGHGNTASDTVVFTVNDNTPPSITAPADSSAFANSVCLSPVPDYRPGTVAADNCGSVTLSQSPAPGTLVGYGPHTITVTANDGHGNTASDIVVFTVNDNTPPVFTSCPTSITIEPTCPSGAIATYPTPTATDNCGATVTRTAGPASGSVFPRGTTTVTHVANDGHGNTATCTFTVTVLTPQAVVQNLINSVNVSSLTGTQKNGLLAKLNAALSAINNGQYNVACPKLSDFVNNVGTLISHGDLSAAQGNAWISSANHVRNTIGCTNLGCS